MSLAPCLVTINDASSLSDIPFGNFICVGEIFLGVSLAPSKEEFHRKTIVILVFKFLYVSVCSKRGPSSHYNLFRSHG